MIPGELAYGTRGEPHQYIGLISLFHASVPIYIDLYFYHEEINQGRMRVN